MKSTQKTTTNHLMKKTQNAFLFDESVQSFVVGQQPFSTNLTEVQLRACAKKRFICVLCKERGVC